MPSFILESERLLLRTPEARDAAMIALLMNDWDVAKNLSRAPFPYCEQDARDFLVRLEEGLAKGTDYTFSVTRKSDGALIGKCGLHLQDSGFELGYWYGRPYWKQGYATEAAAEVVGFAFRNLRAEHVWAGWFHDNPTSGRVLEKLGFRANGTALRDCVARGHGVLCNLVVLKRETFAQRQAA